MKKLLSIVLVIALALSLTVTAFATQNAKNENGTYTGEVKFEGALNIPAINVTIPASGAILLNPYKLTLNSKDSDSDTLVGMGVESPVYTITNTSAVALNVGVIASAQVAGDISLSNKPLVQNTTNGPKGVFVYIGYVAGSASIGDADAAQTALAALTATDDAAANLANGLLILTDSAPETATILGTLPDKNTDGGVGYFMFMGDAQEKTTDPWVTTDSVSATVIFRFTPKASTAPAGPDLTAILTGANVTIATNNSTTLAVDAAATIDHVAKTITVTLTAAGGNGDVITVTPAITGDYTAAAATVTNTGGTWAADVTVSVTDDNNNDAEVAEYTIVVTGP